MLSQDRVRRCSGDHGHGSGAAPARVAAIEAMLAGDVLCGSRCRARCSLPAICDVFRNSFLLSAELRKGDPLVGPR
jgi:hypothetical protein